MSVVHRQRFPSPARLAASVRDKSYQDCPLGEHVAAYLLWKQDETRAAPTTIRDYEIPLAYLCLDYPTLDLAAFEPPEGRKLLRAFLGRHWGRGAPAYPRVGAEKGKRSARTFSKNLSILSDFFNFCVAEDEMRGNPTTGIARPKRDDGRKRRVYQVGEPQRMIDACILDRDRCAVALVCEFGLRKSEIAAVRLGDYDPGRRILTVTGKGQRTRQLPVVNPALVSMLDYHWLARLADGDADEYLIYPQGWGPRADPDGPSKGVNWSDPHRGLQPTAMHRWWKMRLAAAGIPSTRKMHEMRHTAATDLLRSSGNLELVRQMLGHADIKTTAMYSHMEMSDLEEALKLLAEKRAAENEA